MAGEMEVNTNENRSSNTDHSPEDTSTSNSDPPTSTSEPIEGSPEPATTPASGGGGAPVSSALTHVPSIAKPTKRMTVEQLRSDLERLGLDSKGKKDSLYKRLLNGYFASLPPPKPRHPSERLIKYPDACESFDQRLDQAQTNWRSFLCFDVEATCRGGKEFDWPNEIIEFPVVLCQWVDEPHNDSDTTEIDDKQDSQPPSKRRRLEKIDTFHTYVKPVWQPVLSEFCTALTGITQEMVDAGPVFPEMLRLLEAWLDKHDLRDEDGRLKNAVWVTDGPWDLRDFIPKQLHITPTDPPAPPYFFGQYINIKRATQIVLRTEWSRKQAATEDSDEHEVAQPIFTHRTLAKLEREGGLKGPAFHFPIPGQLEALGLAGFEGRQHSGIDDAMNVSRILINLSERPHVIIEPNARTNQHNPRRWPWMGKKPGEVVFEEWMSSQKDALVNGKTFGSAKPNDDEKPLREAGTSANTNGSTPQTLIEGNATDSRVSKHAEGFKTANGR